MEISTGEVILRVLAAGALGGLIGFEREISDQPAGFRTHILVSLGAALFTLVGAYGVAAFLGEGTVRFDPTRIAAQVVTGIGFLGAGAILRQGLNIRGLTTAAALWVTAAIGTAVALGYWAGAIATTVFTVAALAGLKQLERVVFSRLRQGRVRYFIEVGPNLKLDDLTAVVESFKARVDSIKLLADESEGKRMVMDVSLAAASRSPEALAMELQDCEGVESVDWTS